MSKRKTRAAAKGREVETVEAAPKVAAFERERREIAVGLLRPAPWNPRAKITPESVADLAASIASLGVIQPLVAMADADGGATLIAGHRRLAAAKVAGLECVPCDILRGVDEATARRMTFIENLQRKDAEPLLESELVGSLVKSGMTQGEIAAETGRGREWVARRLNLSRLSKSWRKRVKDGERITTDCLEHVAAYPDEVQEKMKGAKSWNAGGALRWCDVEGAFSRETADLKGAGFDRSACRACPNNTGCSPDLFDWDGKPSAFGKCLDPKCYRRKREAAIKAEVSKVRADGYEVREAKQRPDWSVGLQDRRDEQHSTLYVFKDYSGETVAQWGASPAAGQSGGGLTEAQKDERRRKAAANKARRKLAEWCGRADGGLADAIRNRCGAEASDTTVRAYQDAFHVGNAYTLIGTRSSLHDVAVRRLATGASSMSATMGWTDLVADEVARSLGKEVWGPANAKLVCALFEEARDALTEEELHLIASDEELAEVQNPKPIDWISLNESEMTEAE